MQNTGDHLEMEAAYFCVRSVTEAISGRFWYATKPARIGGDVSMYAQRFALYTSVHQALS